MNLTGLHVLLTYQCIYECDHCFVWGSPQQTGTMTLEDMRLFLQQASGCHTIEWIYLEGGEPFLFYPLLLKTAQMAVSLGFQVGVVTNSYWGTSVADAKTWLEPFAYLVHDLSISGDLYHSDEKISQQVLNVRLAAEALNIPVGVISIAQPEESAACSQPGMLPPGVSRVMYRGRAAQTLAKRAPQYAWDTFTACTDEELRNPERVHLDPFGNIHICQGIVACNLFEAPLQESCRVFRPEAHPILGPLIESGPAGLVQKYQLAHLDSYADACHLCYHARLQLRDRFPDELKPLQMYAGVI